MHCLGESYKFSLITDHQASLHVSESFPSVCLLILQVDNSPLISSETRSCREEAIVSRSCVTRCVVLRSRCLRCSSCFSMPGSHTWRCLCVNGSWDSDRHNRSSRGGRCSFSVIALSASEGFQPVPGSSPTHRTPVRSRSVIPGMAETMVNIINELTMA
mgnify:CR=1 FL=1